MHKISKLSALLLIGLVTVSLAFAVTLYTLTITSHWQVQVAEGLVLKYAADGTVVTASNFVWSVPVLGTQTMNFIIYNTANHASNAMQIMPASTSLYQFSTTFVNTTIAQGGHYAFSISLTDLGMDSAHTYSGDFKWLIVDSFSAPQQSDIEIKPAGLGVVGFGSDTAQFFDFVNDDINGTYHSATHSYGFSAGSTVLYAFDTINVNSTVEIQGLTYELQLFDGATLVSTICDGLQVAYYQDATHYMLPSGSGYQGNGTHMTTTPLLPGADMWIWQSFTAPLTPAIVGFYTLHLTYQEHNAAPLPPPTYSIQWTTHITQTGASNLLISNYHITGASNTGETGTVTFTLVDHADSSVSATFTLTIPELSLTIATDAVNNLGMNISINLPYSIPALGGSGGALTMQLTLHGTAA